MKQTNRMVLVFPYLLSGIILIVDWFTPGEYQDWILYAFPAIIICIYAGPKHYCFFISLCSLFILIGLLTPSTSLPLTVSIFNRSVGIVSLWGGTLLLRFLLRANTDIAELKKLRNELNERSAELVAVNADLESFAYSVSHDLRAPLQVISSFGAVLAKECRHKLNDEEMDYVSRILEGGRKMDGLITDILTLSKVSYQGIDLQEIDLRTIASSIVEDIRRSQPDRLVEVSIQQDLTAYADERLMRIALTNLISNSWKFTARTEQPKIELLAREKEGRTLFLIRDNGAGFDISSRPGSLFKPFQRFHPKTQFPGNGIGLSVVSRVIKKHGGEIWAESEIGKGTTFYFELPAK